jgi:hypothetical protein
MNNFERMINELTNYHIMLKQIRQYSLLFENNKEKSGSKSVDKYVIEMVNNEEYNDNDKCMYYKYEQYITYKIALKVTHQTIINKTKLVYSTFEGDINLGDFLTYKNGAIGHCYRFHKEMMKKDKVVNTSFIDKNLTLRRTYFQYLVNVVGVIVDGF